ncbi:MAG: FAD:protein FMN transferase, partial [Gemmatimonadota bacterium]
MRTASALLLLLNTLYANSLAQTACAPAVERTAVRMGTTLRIAACSGERAGAIAAIEASFAEVARLEGVLSSWQNSAEIGRINSAAPHARVPLTEELAGLLREADGWVRATGGAFDPAVGALIDVWGFRTGARVPTAAQIGAALSATGWTHARLDSAFITRGRAGWWIDTGGFGKGAALRSAARILRAHGVHDAVLDFGGQLVVIGGPTELAVAHPAQRDRAVLSLRLRDVSVSTSSQSERFVELNGRRYGHVLDPRTGYPVEAWGSVTVVSPDALAADAISTALFVVGPRAALEWAEQHPDIGVLVLELEH